jgi:hypothetical protein
MATTNVVSSGLASIAPEIQPYYVGTASAPGLLGTAQSVYSKDYATQMGNPLAASGLAGTGRVAGLAPIEQQVGTELTGMQTPSQFAQGTNLIGAGQSNISAGTNAVGMGLSTLQGLTDPYQTQQYMSPYIQDVMNVQKNEALRDAQKQLVGANLASSRQGSYGGARNALMQSEADRNLQTKMGTIQATGMQNAFDAAQKAQLAAAQQYGTYGTQLGSLGAQSGQLGATSGQLGTQQSAADLNRLAAQSAYGGTQRAITQQGLDTRYQDLMTQINYPKTQLAGMQGILTGVPMASIESTQATTTPPPSFASQLAGAGTAGLALFNMFK